MQFYIMLLHKYLSEFPSAKEFTEYIQDFEKFCEKVVEYDPSKRQLLQLRILRDFIII